MSSSTDTIGAATASRSEVFSRFDPGLAPPGSLRLAITAATRRPEPECLPPLIEAATLSPDAQDRARARARKIVVALRRGNHGSGIDGLIHEYSLSSEEGVSLMCLAEALLRIPDDATRDALIRDKVAAGDWLAHVSADRSLFVNAATWGLAITGRLMAPIDQRGLHRTLTRLIARRGEPVIRKAVDMAMRMMGEQFVTGQTINEALDNSRHLAARGFRHSYDMLGEAATTAADAARYFSDYQNAIHAIGKAAGGQGPYRGAGISIKLSALHPRYRRAQIERVRTELLPRLTTLASLAHQYDIGLNIDAEEADRLELSLDLLEALCADPELKGWNGIGFVVQAYGKRCPFVIDYLIDLARRTGHRLMVRLVKGAYWDSEIKQAQIDGLDGFPVFTRKVYSDVSYLACARKLLAASTEIFPQFATHNAQTLATIIEMGGPEFAVGQYEFQCLHGMGEKLYGEVVGPKKLNRPCRIYAPVGSHNTLLAYLVRRLLENGANSSFVNRIADEKISIDDLITDPVAEARAILPLGSPHTGIALPRNILGAGRPNSAGLDLANDNCLRALLPALEAGAASTWRASPPNVEGGAVQRVTNPADIEDVVGEVQFAEPAVIAPIFANAAAAAPDWAATPPAERARILLLAADLFEARMPVLIGLIIREAGKSAMNAVGEVRETVDFLRYYAATARDSFNNATHVPLGTIVCISPWNFPLSIFTGQLSAALAAGNVVIAKPAEETPLIAAEGVRLLHEAGVPGAVLQMVPGAGEIGAALVAHPDVHGVVFTGSTEVARLIQRQLAERLLPDNRPIPLIAETGGQNAMIVDSSALTEQVVADVLASAFDSAGQRCSALRLLCLQDDIAERTLAMVKGAMAQLRTGNPVRLATDVGPVITAGAREVILAHIEALRLAGHTVTEAPMAPEVAAGTFVAPTLIEIDSAAELTREVFGPVLHVVRYQRKNLEQLVDSINRLGYGLTFGLHTRLDETIDRVVSRVRVGNIYVNRNMIGAVVGVQPFGGHGLSGTGPKAGGPLYMRRLLAACPAAALPEAASAPGAGPTRYLDWLAKNGHGQIAARVAAVAKAAPVGVRLTLAGPVGEDNVYGVVPRGTILCRAETVPGLLFQLGAVLATGNRAVIEAPQRVTAILAGLPADLAGAITLAPKPGTALSGALVEGGPDAILAAGRELAVRPGAIVTFQGTTSEGLAAGTETYSLDLLATEISTSINTAAAGGNASLMVLT